MKQRFGSPWGHTKSAILWRIFNISAQRLVAQAHGHFRDVVTILAGNLQLHFGVSSLSLGHVACSHVLGGVYFFTSLITCTFILMTILSIVITIYQTLGSNR
jgi:hypothetical protein